MAGPEPGRRSTGPACGGAPPARGRGHSTRAHCPRREPYPACKMQGIVLEIAAVGGPGCGVGHGGLPWGPLREGPKEAEPQGATWRRNSSTSGPWEEEEGTWTPCDATGHIACLLPEARSRPMVDGLELDLLPGAWSLWTCWLSHTATPATWSASTCLGLTQKPPIGATDRRKV